MKAGKQPLQVKLEASREAFLLLLLSCWLCNRTFLIGGFFFPPSSHIAVVPRCPSSKRSLRSFFSCNVICGDTFCPRAHMNLCQYCLVKKWHVHKWLKMGDTQIPGRQEGWTILAVLCSACLGTPSKGFCRERNK